MVRPTPSLDKNVPFILVPSDSQQRVKPSCRVLSMVVGRWTATNKMLLESRFFFFFFQTFRSACIILCFSSLQVRFARYIITLDPSPDHDAL